jgi:hypothetical protein
MVFSFLPAYNARGRGVVVLAEWLRSVAEWSVGVS